MNTTTGPNNNVLDMYLVNQSSSSSGSNSVLDNVSLSLSILEMLSNTTIAPTTPPRPPSSPSSMVRPPRKGSPPGVLSFSITQRKWLAYAPKVPAFLSILGSAWIMYDLLSVGTSPTNNAPRQRGQRHNSNHRLDSTHDRILLCMSSVDLLSSIWLFIGTWAASEERAISDGLRPLLFGSDKSNQATCSAQGFFLQLGIAAPLYNVSLAIYSLLVVRYNYQESRFSWRQSRRQSYSLWCSWALLGLPMIWALSTAIAGLALQLYNLNAATLYCWISPYPANCDPIFGQSRGLPNASRDCQRGTNANKYRFAFAFVPLWLAWIVMVIALLLVVQAVYQLERRAHRWSFSSQSFSNKSARNVTAQPNLGKDQNGDTIHHSDDHDDNQSIQDPPMMSDTLIASSKSDIQERDEEEKEEEVMDPLYNSEESEAQIHENAEEGEQQGTDATTDANNSLTGSTATTTAPLSNHQPQPLSPKSKLRRLSFQGFRSSMTGGLASLPRSVMTSSIDDSAAEQRQEKANLTKTRKVGVQALCFVLAFLVTWTCSMIYQLLLMRSFSHYEGGGLVDSFAFIFLAAMLFPLQGFLNALVVIRPRYIQARERHPTWSWFQMLHFVLFRHNGTNASSNNNNNNTNSDGSSNNCHPNNSATRNKGDSNNSVWRGLASKFFLTNKNEEAPVTGQ